MLAEQKEKCGDNCETSSYAKLPPTAVAAEELEERLTKFSVHETIRDGITTSGDVGQQLHQADAVAAYNSVHQIWREDVPRVDDMQRRPTYEELQDYHEEHADHLQHHAASAFDVR